MMQGGRIRHHIKHYIEDQNTLILVIGYQVAGSLGRKILDGERTVMIDKEEFTVRARVQAIGGYSAHADQTKLLQWVGNGQQLKHIWLTHGELDAAQALAAAIQKNRSVTTDIPQLGDSIELE